MDQNIYKLFDLKYCQTDAMFYIKKIADIKISN